MLDAEHVHRAALSLGDTGLAPGQLGHDDLGIDAVGEHVAVVAIAGDDAVLVRIERRLEADRHRFLADVEMAEAADEAKPVKLPGALLEAADEQHLAIILDRQSVVWGKRVSVRVALGVRRNFTKKKA